MRMNSKQLEALTRRTTPTFLSGRPEAPLIPRRRAPRASAARVEDAPPPTAVSAARARAGLTQADAGALVHTTARVWRQWEAGDRRMHPAFFELFRLKTARTR